MDGRIEETTNYPHKTSNCAGVERCLTFKHIWIEFINSLIAAQRAGSFTHLTSVTFSPSYEAKKIASIRSDVFMRMRYALYLSDPFASVNEEAER